MTDLENKFRGDGGKNTWVVFDYQKAPSEEKNDKENDFLIFNCQIKKVGLCFWFS